MLVVTVYKACKSYGELEADAQCFKREADFYYKELEKSEADVLRLRQALKHVVNCFPDMRLVGLQTAEMALGEA